RVSGEEAERCGGVVLDEPRQDRRGIRELSTDECVGIDRYLPLSEIDGREARQESSGPFRGDRHLAALAESLHGILMNGHEHAVSIFARRKLDQRLIGEAGHGLDDLAEVVRQVRADGLGTLKGEATREDPEPPKDTLLGRVEERVTPLDGRPQTRMAVIAAALGGEGAEGSGHGPGESRSAHVSRASGGELDRERQPVGRATDRGAIGARRPIENEAWLSESGAFDEEPHGVRRESLPDPAFTRRRRNGEW